MLRYRGYDFSIGLPDEFRDESTYAFAIPTKASFQPSVVVKTERLKSSQALPAYVHGQTATISKVLANLVVAESAAGMQNERPVHRLVYDWGPAERRVRQMQLYIQLDKPLRIVTLTATHLSGLFADIEPLVNSIFASFTPMEPDLERE